MWSATAGAGGTGGGGAGGATTSSPGVAGTANTGGGGGGGSTNGTTQNNGGNGGSGIVIISFSNTADDLIIGSGLTYRDSGGSSASGNGTRVAPSYSTGGNKVYEFTAGTGNVSW